MQSKEQPKKIIFSCSNGKAIPFLLKFEKCDVRLESRTVDFINFIRVLLDEGDEFSSNDL